jgi:tetratricopeptide (TPR) repeat protein
MTKQRGILEGMTIPGKEMTVKEKINSELSKEESCRIYDELRKMMMQNYKPDAIIKMLTEELTKYKNNPGLLGWRALAYSWNKDYDNAFEDYSKAIELEPNNAYFYICRADTYMEFENYKNAIADYTKAIEINGGISSAFVSRGNARYKIDDLDGAIEDYEKALIIFQNER